MVPVKSTSDGCKGESLEEVDIGGLIIGSYTGSTEYLKKEEHPTSAHGQADRHAGQLHHLNKEHARNLKQRMHDKG